MRTTTLSVLLVAAVASGCSSTPARNASPGEGKHAPPTQAQASERASSEELARAEAFRNQSVRRKALQQAYKRGVRDILEDFRGRTRAQQGFTYEPPVIDYVEMPARAINGAVYPSHKQPVIYRPGRWVERNGAQYTAPAGASYGQPNGQGAGAVIGGANTGGRTQRSYTGDGPYPDAGAASMTPCCDSDTE